MGFKQHSKYLITRPIKPKTFNQFDYKLLCDTVNETWHTDIHYASPTNLRVTDYNVTSAGFKLLDWAITPGGG